MIGSGIAFNKSGEGVLVVDGDPLQQSAVIFNAVLRDRPKTLNGVFVCR